MVCYVEISMYIILILWLDLSVNDIMHISSLQSYICHKASDPKYLGLISFFEKWRLYIHEALDLRSSCSHFKPVNPSAQLQV